MPQHKYLVSVNYNQEKSEIICYFKNASSQTALRFPFKPYFLLNFSFNEKMVSDFLVELGFKNFEVFLKNNLLAISSKSLTNLKNISTALAICSNKKFLILEPERVFLLEKNWSYFDSFEFSNNSFTKTCSKKNFAFHLIPELSFSEAFLLNEVETKNLLQKSVLSNILKVFFNNIPDSIEAQTELFLENIFFKNGEPIIWNNDSKFFSTNFFIPFGYFSNLCEIDFSFVWTQLLSKNFFNISSKTMNCNCCKPIKLDDKNLLPNSMIEVISLEDDFFYVSTSTTFSSIFHKNNSGKHFRLQKKKEFFLTSFPIGPFKKNSSFLIPLDDAIMLLNEKKIILSKNHSLRWFCLIEESFLSKELNYFFELLDKSSLNLSEYSSKLFLEPDFCFLFDEYFNFFLKQILSEIPLQLKKPFSKFFVVNLAESINSIQESVLFKFKDFSEKKGYRIIYTTNKNVFVSGRKTLSLTKTFAKTLKLPQPIISGFSNKTSFR